MPARWSTTGSPVHACSRALDVAARNHDSLPDGGPPHAPLSSIAVPTLVIHGTADPVFPLPHGEALAERIPGARLLPLEDAGHGIDRADRPTVVPAILGHTAADGSGRGASRPWTTGPGPAARPGLTPSPGR